MFSSGPKYQKLTTNLRLSINRLKLLEKKKTEMALKARKEIAAYLADGKEDRARIRVEHIIREDYLVEAMEIIEMYCDLLLARMGLIQSTKELDEGLEEPIATLLWVTPRMQAEVAELKVVSDQFTAKYGKEFVASCRSNQLNNVNEKLMHKMAVQAPPRMLIEKYLEEIARTYNVPFVPDPGAVEVEEAAAANQMLIDLESKSNGGAGGGISNPMQPSQAPYPPAQPSFEGFGGYPPAAGAYPPAQPGPPPPGEMYPPGPPQDQFQAPPLPGKGPSGPAGTSADLPPAYHPSPNLPSPGGPPPAPPNIGFEDFPELPSVPATSVAPPRPGGASAGNDDVDFDDLTKRFEELKKRK